MDCVQARKTTNRIAKGSWVGMPIMARKIADGRWVKTIVRTLPRRLAMEAATKIDMAEMMLVMKKRVPMAPEDRWKRRWK